MITTGHINPLSPLSRRASAELRRLGQASPLAQPIPSIRPSIIAGVGLAGFGLGSQLVPAKNKTIRNLMMLGAALSGLLGAYLFTTGK